MKRTIFIIFCMVFLLSGCGEYSSNKSYISDNYNIDEIYDKSDVLDYAFSYCEDDIKQYVAENYSPGDIFDDAQLLEWYHYSGYEGTDARVDELTGEIVATRTQRVVEQSNNTYDYYIINKSTKVFHRPDCYSVDAMKESNKVISYETYQKLYDSGFKPCGNESW